MIRPLMQALKVSALLACVAFAAGCSSGSEAPRRVGIGVLPPGARVIGFDPGVTGLSGGVGEIVFNPGANAAYVKSGSNNTDWQGFPSAAASPTSPGLMSAAQATALQGGVPGYAFFSQVVNLFATPAAYQVIPPTPARLWLNAAKWEIKTTAGTISTSPTFQGGSDSASVPVNLMASQTAAGFTTQAAETLVGVTTASPLTAIDLTTNGLVIAVTTAATGTGSPALTARFFGVGMLLPE